MQPFPFCRVWRLEPRGRTLADARCDGGIDDRWSDHLRLVLRRRDPERGRTLSRSQCGHVPPDLAGYRPGRSLCTVARYPCDRGLSRWLARRLACGAPVAKTSTVQYN